MRIFINNLLLLKITFELQVQSYTTEILWQYLYNLLRYKNLTQPMLKFSL